jgi:hypothetical protein
MEQILDPQYVVLVLQSVSTFVWFFIISLPLNFIALQIGQEENSLVQNAVQSLLITFILSALTVCLGVVRFLRSGEIRKIEFGAIPYLLRSFLFASPMHALHGFSVATVAFVLGDLLHFFTSKRNVFFFLFSSGMDVLSDSFSGKETATGISSWES